MTFGEALERLAKVPKSAIADKRKNAGAQKAPRVSRAKRGKSG